MENEYFPGLDEIRAVQHTRKRTFSNAESRVGACGASYRRVCVYTKSLERWRLERERRRKVRVLAEKGYSQKQIARELGVSTRTVKRDWDKARSYVVGFFFGCGIGRIFGNKVKIVGGLILIAIGIRILLEHLAG